MKLSGIVYKILEDRQADREFRREAEELYKVLLHISDKVTGMAHEIYQVAKNATPNSREANFIEITKNFKIAERMQGGYLPFQINRGYDYVEFDPQAITPKFDSVYVRLYEKNKRANALGDYRAPRPNDPYGDMHWINLYILNSSIDLDRADDVYLVCENLYKLIKKNKSIIVHEYIHKLDTVRIRKNSPNYVAKSGRYHKNKQLDKYFNSPEEFNAYYQQGVEKLWDMFNRHKRTNEPLIPWEIKADYWNNPNAKPPKLDFNFFVENYIDPETAIYTDRFPSPFHSSFYKQISNDSRKRLLKRLYGEYKELVKQGFWQLGEDKYFATERDENDPYVDKRKNFRNLPNN